MVALLEVRTARLWLRPWREEDVEPFAAMNADARVMEHFPARLSREETEAVVGRLRAHFEQHGWGLWAVEAPGVAPFAGFVGLTTVPFAAPFTPGWRWAGAWPSSTGGGATRRRAHARRWTWPLAGWALRRWCP